MALSMARAVWNYRGFVVGSVKREFQTRYRNSLLGATWTILNPLSMIIVYTVIFSQLMKARLPGVDNSLAYGIYLCAGILAWGFFAEVIGRISGRISGDMSVEVLDIIVSTTRSVFIGIVGTAAAQAMVLPPEAPGAGNGA